MTEQTQFRRLKIALAGASVLMLLWVGLVPAIWTLCVHDCIGHSDGHTMRINSVQPWPDLPLWVYSGKWIHPAEVTEHGVEIPEFEMSGYCYVWEMTIE